MQLRLEQGGQSVTLMPQPLARGGEAFIFAVEGEESLVAKMIHRPTAEQAEKLAVMIAHPPIDPMAASGHPSIAWPLDRLFSDEHPPRCVGFIMPRITAARSIFEYYNPRTRRRQSPLFHYRYLMRTARNLAAAFSALHTAGYVIGDVNESNILVSETALATLVDTDSFQVTTPQRRYRCPVGKPEFTPPELQGLRFREIDRKPHHDAFGLAVLIFMLLMEGTHPFAGRMEQDWDHASLGDRIAANYYPYSVSRQLPYEPMPTAPPIGILHPEIRALMQQCFEVGHHTPEARPTAAEWQRALDKAESNLRLCRFNTQHYYRFSLGGCPWCERATRLNGWDPFPSIETIRNGAHLQPVLTIVDPAAQAPIPPLTTQPAPPKPRE